MKYHYNYGFFQQWLDANTHIPKGVIQEAFATSSNNRIKAGQEVKALCLCLAFCASAIASRCHCHRSSAMKTAIRTTTTRQYLRNQVI